MIWKEVGLRAKEEGLRVKREGLHPLPRAVLAL